MSQRDARGRFVKARPFKVGDRVRATYSSAFFSKGDVGIIREVGSDGSHLIDFNGQGNKSVSEGGEWWCGAHSPVELLEPAPQPKAEELLAAIRSATGVPASEGPDLVGVVRSIASQMDRHRLERDEARHGIATLKAEVERLDAERRTALFCADHYKASCDGLKKDWDDAKRRAEAAEAKLADIAAIKRVQELEPNLPATKLIQRVLDGAA